MNIEFKESEKSLFVLLKGELDHNFLEKYRERIEMKIATGEQKNIVLDFNNLTFMDSSGISLVYDAYKTALSVDKKVFAFVKNEKYKKILTLAKIEKFVKIVDEYKEGK